MVTIDILYPRMRKYLTPGEVKRLLDAARKPRDKAMILMAYRHGLRVSELVNLQWQDIDMETALFHVSRLKNGSPSVHPMQKDEIEALQAMKWPLYKAQGPVFRAKHGGAMTANGFYRNLRDIGIAAGLPLKVHPHMLRHATGFKLANDGVDTRALQAYLGHRNIQHTVTYTELAPERFRGFWKHAQNAA